MVISKTTRIIILIELMIAIAVYTAYVCYVKAQNNKNEIRCVSLVQLLANPQKYHGHRILVDGIGEIAFESNSLYLAKEYYDYRVSQYALWLDLSEKLTGEINTEELNGKMVRVIGRFDCRGHGHLASYPGTITEIVVYEGLEYYGE